MSTRLNMTCPHCVTTLGTDPAEHRVYRGTETAPAPDAPLARCERCGGHWYGGVKWRYFCQTCNITVAPGELRGLFVPHLCAACLQQKVRHEEAAGQVCRLCNKAYALCCC